MEIETVKSNLASYLGFGSTYQSIIEAIIYTVIKDSTELNLTSPANLTFSRKDETVSYMRNDSPRPTQLTTPIKGMDLAKILTESELSILQKFLDEKIQIVVWKKDRSQYVFQNPTLDKSLHAVVSDFAKTFKFLLSHYIYFHALSTEAEFAPQQYAQIAWILREDPLLNQQVLKQVSILSKSSCERSPNALSGKRALHKIVCDDLLWTWESPIKIHPAASSYATHLAFQKVDASIYKNYIFYIQSGGHVQMLIKQGTDSAHEYEKIKKNPATFPTHAQYLNFKGHTDTAGQKADIKKLIPRRLLRDQEETMKELNDVIIQAINASASFKRAHSSTQSAALTLYLFNKNFKRFLAQRHAVQLTHKLSTNSGWDPIPDPQEAIEYIEKTLTIEVPSLCNKAFISEEAAGISSTFSAYWALKGDRKTFQILHDAISNIIEKAKPQSNVTQEDLETILGTLPLITCFDDSPSEMVQTLITELNVLITKHQKKLYNTYHEGIGFQRHFVSSLSKAIANSKASGYSVDIGHSLLDIILSVQRTTKTDALWCICSLFTRAKALTAEGKSIALDTYTRENGLLSWEHAAPTAKLQPPAGDSEHAFNTFRSAGKRVTILPTVN
ncbi:hypothetical protein [Candidatus Synchoanobacter obligatus]|uniref:Uncharacterized protein n=1 Tax=Candidatus Synchoanobacter obligatus TaxID=2919597 RepID=A0ABT1L469_9GAMM|nr:hypothetical protein [Candidatus Synchoanobacter obligatus]MCP8351756.1 hypothetical protein [Candidatus Synchoanobacter obligatus]